MKPPPFRYHRAESVEDALAALTEHGSDAKLLAGGQSLLPLLNFRLLSPEVLVDIHRLSGLAEIEDRGGALSIGALCTHQQVEMSEIAWRSLPILRVAAGEIGHLAIRNRGTFGGSVVHNDPAAEWPLICVLLGATFVLAGSGGRREVAAAEFFSGYLETTLGPSEMLLECSLPHPAAGAGWGFRELSRRKGDFALASAAAILEVVGGAVRSAKVAVGGAAATAIRVPEAERLMAGQAWDLEMKGAVYEAVTDACDPSNDIHASADYRRHAAGVLATRAIADAWDRVVETGTSRGGVQA